LASGETARDAGDTTNSFRFPVITGFGDRSAKIMGNANTD